MYDESGRIARTIARGTWTEEDRALVLAYGRYKATLCDRCGQPRHLAWHPDNEGWFEVDEEDDYVTCWACTALAQADNAEAEPVRHLVRLRYERPEDRPLPPFDPYDPTRPPHQTSKQTGGGAGDGERSVGHSSA